MMHNTRFLTAAFAATLMTTAFGSIACNRTDADKVAAPAAQIATETPSQPMNQPQTVEGCLRAGEGGTTFVLTTAQSDTGSQPATYALTASDNLDLAGHVDERVSVSGTLQAQQQASTETPAMPSKPTHRGYADGQHGDGSHDSAPCGLQRSLARRSLRQVVL